MVVGCSSPCSQGPTISDHPYTLESSPQIPILFKGYFRIALPSVPRLFKCSLFVSLLRATCRPTYPILLNLITLVAFCRSKNQRALRYESLPSVLLRSLSYIQTYCSHYFVQWPTKTQLINKLSHSSYMFRHYCVILRQFVVSPPLTLHNPYWVCILQPSIGL